MKLSEKAKTIICIVCFLLFFLGGGFGPNPIYTSYLPNELYRTMIIEDGFKTIAFLIMLSVFEPTRFEYKNRHYNVTVFINIIVILYFIFVYYRVFANL